MLNIPMPAAPEGQKLPKRIVADIDMSTAEFKAKFPIFLSGVVDQYGDEYRAELTRIARRAYSWGWNDCSELDKPADA